MSTVQVIRDQVLRPTELVPALSANRTLNAQLRQGQMVEENLFYDLMGMLKQIGVMPELAQKAA